MTALALPVLSLLLAAPARPQGQINWKTVGCGCYCGKVLSPPCSDQACLSACGGGSSSGGGYGQPPMAGIRPGKWTRHFGTRYREKIQDCGPKPLCMLMTTVAGGIVLPIGLAVDAPVFVAKGVAYGGYYAAVGTGKGLKAVGRGLAYPFRRRPKPVVAITEPSPPPAPPPAADTCAQALVAHSSALDEERREAESFNAAIVTGHLDHGLDLAKDALQAKFWEKPEWEAPKVGDFDLKLGALKAKEKLETADKAGEYARALRSFHRDTRKCLTAAEGGSSGLVDCLNALNAAHAKLFDEIKGRGAKVTAAAKDAYQKYVERALRKSEGLIQEAARCSGT